MRLADAHEHHRLLLAALADEPTARLVAEAHAPVMGGHGGPVCDGLAVGCWNSMDDVPWTYPCGTTAIMLRAMKVIKS